MNNNLAKIIEVINRKKKRIITGISILAIVVIGVGAVGVGLMYKNATSNINYTEEQAKEIALANIPGEVVKVERDIELEDATVKYEFKIKDSNNILREVTVDAKIGAVIDFEEYED